MRARDDFTRAIDQRIDQVLGNPQGWGGVDALEPLVLMLLMLRAEFANPPSPRTEVLRQYRRFLAGRFEPGVGDLRERLGPRLSPEAMVAVLREHTAIVRAQTVPSSQSPSRDRSAQPRPVKTHVFPMFGSIEIEAP